MSKTSITAITIKLETYKQTIEDGTITKEQAKELYDHFESLPVKEKGKGIQSFLDSLQLSDKSLHHFVGLLFSVEADALNQGSLKDNPKEKRAQFIRNTSLAKMAFNQECIRHKLGKEVFEQLESGNQDGALKALQSIKIPAPILDHYAKIIKPFYKKNEDTLGAAVNLSFHGVQTIVTTGYKQEDKNKITRSFIEAWKTHKEPLKLSLDEQIDSYAKSSTELNLSTEKPPLKATIGTPKQQLGDIGKPKAIGKAASAPVQIKQQSRLSFAGIQNMRGRSVKCVKAIFLPL